MTSSAHHAYNIHKFNFPFLCSLAGLAGTGMALSLGLGACTAGGGSCTDCVGSVTVVDTSSSMFFAREGGLDPQPVIVECNIVENKTGIVSL